MRNTLTKLRDWHCLRALVWSIAVITTVAACSAAKWHLISAGEHPHTPTFLAVSFTEPSHGWGLTPNGLFETNDGGKHWAPIIEGSNANRTFFSLEFVNGMTGFIVGAQGHGTDRSPLILRTRDAGKTWEETLIGSEKPAGTRAGLLLHSISFCDPQVGWAVGSNLIVRTSNGGQTWDIQRSNNEEVLFSVACIDQERAWAAGQDGLILFTADGGKSWSRQASGTTDNLARVRFFGNDGWIVGGIGGKSVLLRTRDLGASWDLQELKLSEPLFDIYMNGKHGWIVGATGTILETSDAGQTWKQQQSPTKSDLTCLFFLSPRQGWAGGNKRTLLQFSE